MIVNFVIPMWLIWTFGILGGAILLALAIFGVIALVMLSGFTLWR